MIKEGKKIETYTLILVEKTSFMMTIIGQAVIAWNSRSDCGKMV
jgi:hypothetical protein